MRLIRAVVRMMEGRREQAVARDLLVHHDIVMGAAIKPVCQDALCREHSAHLTEAEKRMHQQSHRLHVLQWKGDRFAAEVTKDRPEVVRSS